MIICDAPTVLIQRRCCRRSAGAADVSTLADLLPLERQQRLAAARVARRDPQFEKIDS